MTFPFSVLAVCSVIWISVAGVWGWRWRQRALTLYRIGEEQERTLLAVTVQREQQQDRALKLLAERNRLRDEVSRLHVAVTHVCAIVTRRPLRRKWLALARRVARAAAVS